MRTNTRQSVSAEERRLNPALSHFHMSGLRDAEESQMRRKLVILKH